MAEAKEWKYLNGITEEELVRQAREDYHYGIDSDREDRDEAQHDIRFLAGGENQWDPDAIAMRRPKDPSRPPRPVLTWNRLHGSVYQVCNDGRANKPGIHVSQMDEGSPEMEEYFQARIRQIEYETDADIAYDTARQQAVSCARGFVRLRTDYRSIDSFEQQIHIDEIENQFSVILDPGARQYDRQDGDFAFIFSMIAKNNFKRKYGEKAFEQYTTFFEGDGATYASEWHSNDREVPEVEYWVRQYIPDTLYDLGELGAKLESQMTPEEIELVKQLNPKKRKVQRPRVVQFVIDGSQILSEALWIGSTIPVFPHWGDSMVVDGKRRTFSLIRHAKGPQMLLNLTISNIAELTSQIPKTKYMAAENQLAGHEKEWEPNSPHVVRYYKLYDASGRPYPSPPQSDQTEPPIQALVQQAGMCIDATKAGTNIFDAALGNKSNETSGKAINARKVESDTANYHFADNESRTRKSIGRALVEIIPILDRNKKQVTIRDIDGKTRIVPLRQPFQDPKTGKQITIDPEKGRYSVYVTQGPSYNSQREQAFDIYSEIAKADPNFMGVAGDILFRNMDAPGADDIADRYEQGVIPPALRKPKEGEPNIPPEAAQMIEQAKQNLQRLNAYAQAVEKELAQAKTELSQRITEKRLEIESKKEIVGLQEETKRLNKLAELQSQSGIILLQTKIAEIEKRMELAQQAQQMQSQMLDKEQERALRRDEIAASATPGAEEVPAEQAQGMMPPPAEAGAQIQPEGMV